MTACIMSSLPPRPNPPHHCRFLPNSPFCALFFPPAPSCPCSCRPWSVIQERRHNKPCTLFQHTQEPDHHLHSARTESRYVREKQTTRDTQIRAYLHASGWEKEASIEEESKKSSEQDCWRLHEPRTGTVDSDGGLETTETEEGREARKPEGEGRQAGSEQLEILRSIATRPAFEKS